MSVLQKRFVEIIVLMWLINYLCFFWAADKFKSKVVKAIKVISSIFLRVKIFVQFFSSNWIYNSRIYFYIDL